ncbi:MAG: hypothetical protein AABY22_21635 [Nanoarchaeota archaeon]
MKTKIIEILKDFEEDIHGVGTSCRETLIPKIYAIYTDKLLDLFESQKVTENVNLCKPNSVPLTAEERASVNEFFENIQNEIS